MRKYISMGTLFIVVALIAIYTFGSILLGNAIELGIETIVPRLTESPVTIDKLRISPLTGSGTINGFVMGNPEGFKSDHAFKCEKVHLNIKVSALLTGRIVIEKFHVIGPEFMYERKLTTSNFKQILKNLEGDEKDAEEEPEKPDSDSEMLVEIEDFLVDEAKISMSMVGITVPLTLNTIEMTDIGTEEGGLPSDKVAFKVITQVFRKVVGAVASSPLKIIPGGKE